MVWYVSLSLLSFCQGYVRSLSPPLVSCLLSSTAKLDKSIIEKKKKGSEIKCLEHFIESPSFLSEQYLLHTLYYIQIYTQKRK